MKPTLPPEVSKRYNAMIDANCNDRNGDHNFLVAVDLSRDFLAQELESAKREAIAKAFDWIWPRWNLDLGNKDRALKHYIDSLTPKEASNEEECPYRQAYGVHPDKCSYCSTPPKLSTDKKESNE